MIISRSLWSGLNLVVRPTVLSPVNMTFTGNTSVQLVMLYNTIYLVNVTATLCGQTNATNIRRIHYGEKLVKITLHTVSIGIATDQLFCI